MLGQIKSKKLQGGVGVIQIRLGYIGPRLGWIKLGIIQVKMGLSQTKPKFFWVGPKGTHLI